MPKIRVKCNQRIFIAQYVSIDPSVEIEDEPREGESLKEAYTRIHNLAEAMLYLQIVSDCEGYVNPGHTLPQICDEAVAKLEKMLESNPELLK